MPGKSLPAIANEFDDRIAGRVGRLIATLVRRVDPHRKALNHLPQALGWHAMNWLDVWTARTEVHHSPAMLPAECAHVLLVSHDLSATGAPRVIVEIAGILLAHGIGVVVLTAKDGPWKSRLLELGAAVLINAAVLTPHSSLASSLAAGTRIAICNTVVAAHIVRRLSSVLPTFWYLHEVSMLVDDLAKHKYLAGTFARPQGVWAGSELCAVLIRPFRATVRVVPYGLDPLKPALKNLPGTHAGPLRIAVFGSFEKRKGQDLAVEAIHLLSPTERSALELTLYGRVLQPEFFAVVEEALSRTPEARFCGDLDAAAYEAEAVAVDAVLVPSRDDTLPLVSLDALGAGRVLMCTSTTGTSAYLHSGVDGFVSINADPESIGAMLSAAIARRAEWPAIGKAGEALFSTTFSKTAFSNCILDAIRPFLGEAKVEA